MILSLNTEQLVLTGMLSSTVHWVVARSKIAEPLWSRARGFLGELLSCAGCSGFWIGLGLGASRLVTPVSTGGDRVLETLTTAFLATFLTPVFEGVLLWGLAQSAIEPTPPDVEETLDVTPERDTLKPFPATTPMDNSASYHPRLFKDFEDGVSSDPDKTPKIG